MIYSKDAQIKDICRQSFADAALAGRTGFRKRRRKEYQRFSNTSAGGEYGGPSILIRIFRKNCLMRCYKADLHIHTVLSPCTDLSMGPHHIVKKAVELGLDIIGITDHNSCENAQAVIDVAKDKALTVLPGMEIYTREEAHLICLFESLEADLAFQKIVYDHLPDGENDPDWQGRQLIVDAAENVIGECPKLLSLPTNLQAEAVLNLVSEFGGICYPAHIDRPVNSLLHVLGFIPSNWPIHAVEIAGSLESTTREHRFLKSTNYAVIRSSDSHFIEQLGEACTLFKMEKPTFEEICLAIEKRDGRESLPADDETKSNRIISSVISH